MKILIASTNPGKIKELSAMLSETNQAVQWLGLDAFPNIHEVDEDGTTFEENSHKKALGYAAQSGLWTIADDSGLVIDALDGAPGVKSARFSGEKTVNDDGTLIDHRNIQKVLKLLAGVPDEKRTARFVCNLTLASPEKILLNTQGYLEGYITHKETGDNGFGYDPIVYLPEMNKTVAQLDAVTKNSISHRAKATQLMKPELEKLIKQIHN